MNQRLRRFRECGRLPWSLTVLLWTAAQAPSGAGKEAALRPFSAATCKPIPKVVPEERSFATTVRAEDTTRFEHLMWSRFFPTGGSRSQGLFGRETFVCERVGVGLDHKPPSVVARGWCNPKL